jgi:hypothetical protein
MVASDQVLDTLCVKDLPFHEPLTVKRRPPLTFGMDEDAVRKRVLRTGYFFVALLGDGATRTVCLELIFAHVPRVKPRIAP